MGKWIDYKEIDWDNQDFKAYHVDTRDFHCSANDYQPVIDFHKTRKYPSQYFHTKEEIIKLLDRYFEESGGKGEWRMFSLSGEATHRTQNWQLKYIRIYRTEKGFVVYNENEKFLFSKAMLAYPVNQKYLHKH